MKTIVSLLLALLCWPVLADEPVVMPTDGSWCLKMKVPGMHEMPRPVRRYNIYTNEPIYPTEVDLLIPILDVLAPHRGDGNRPAWNVNEGFAVEGTGLDALNKTFDVLVDKKPIQGNFSEGTELSLVIRSPSLEVEILSVTRDQGAIEIKYVVPNFTRANEVSEGGPPYARSAIALIPVGKLPVGVYHVSFTRVPYQPKPGETVIPFPADVDPILISKPFSFGVRQVQP